MEETIGFPLDILEFNLEDRKEFIKNHNEEMIYICSSLEHFYEDLTHAVEVGLSHSVASNLTYNMVLSLAKGLTSLTIYEYIRGAYILDDEYDTVYKIWESVYDSMKKIIPLLTKLDEENYFEEDVDYEDFINDIIPPHCTKINGCKSLLNLQRRISLITGNCLVNSLICNLRYMEQWLSEFKIGIYNGLGDDYNRIYLANYKLYRKEYWTNDGRIFRSHIENHKPHFEQLTPDYLAKLLWEEQKDFEHTDTGMLWRDFFEDKRGLYFEAKRINLKEDQWRYFFKQICRFEEYEKWIEELKNPNIQDPNVGEETPNNINEKIVACFTKGLLKVEEPNLLYFLMLAMWTRRLLQSKEITSFVRMVGEAYPAIYNEERTQERVIMSLQNMNGKSIQYFADYIKDQSTMIEFVESMYPKKKNGGRRKECERVVNLTEKLFLALK